MEQAQRKNPSGSRSNKTTAWSCPSAAAGARWSPLERRCSCPASRPW